MFSLEETMRNDFYVAQLSRKAQTAPTAVLQHLKGH
jgi:predicted transcriptional regulator